ncbi:methyltransferase domain-containing protein [Microbulbifer sp. ARAS458-1]|uniref:methyltransferase domain-containing protein n=1 Tax=Microbulbifer sp. ARAS458-1 TaxID=3140242 RepID=UPI003877FC3D
MSASAASSWQSYWQQADDKKVCELGGTDHPAISQFWHRFFSDARLGAKSASRKLRIVDIASGSGAVFEHLFSIVDEECCDSVCVDLSYGAVKAVKNRRRAVSGVVANGLALPFTESCADIVVSQFGIEYAGFEAVTGLQSLIRPRGRLALLLHHRGGAIYDECYHNYLALREVQKSGFLQGAIAMFPHAFSVLKGEERSEYERVSKGLIPAFRHMERIMAQYGNQVAGGVVRKLYLDVDHIHSNLPAFALHEVDAWLRQAVCELESYAERMFSMCQSALDIEQFESLKKELTSEGFQLYVAESLNAPDCSAPLAWSILAAKEN